MRWSSAIGGRARHPACATTIKAFAGFNHPTKARTRTGEQKRPKVFISSMRGDCGGGNHALHVVADGNDPIAIDHSMFTHDVTAIVRRQAG